MKSKDFWMSSVALTTIALVVAILLASVNKLTAPIIEEGNQKAKVLAQQKVLAAESFLETSEPSVSVGKQNGETVGYAVSVSPNGYGGAISMMVGLDSSFKVSGVEIISLSETPGLGANATNPDFLTQFEGKDENLSVVKNEPKENEIKALTSATITSKAVAEGIQQAVSLAKSAKEVGSTEAGSTEDGSAEATEPPVGEQAAEKDGGATQQ